MTSIIDTGTTYRVTGNHPARAARVISCHGDGGDATREATLGATVRATTASNVASAGLTDGLLAAGYTVDWPWTGVCWGTNSVAYPARGGGGMAAIDTVAGPTGPVHLIGTSMGGHTAPVWAAGDVGRVASLTLISPAVDVLAIYDAYVGNPIVGAIADEILICRCGSDTATRTDLVDALTDAGHTIDQITAALTPIAERIWIVTASDDPLIPVDMVTGFADAVGVPDDQVVVFDTGQPTDRHPAPYRPDLGWDPHTTLRQVTAWA